MSGSSREENLGLGAGGPASGFILKSLVGLVLVFLLVPRSAHAQTQGSSLDSDWALAMPQATVIEMMKSKNFALRVPKTDFEYNDPTPGQVIQSRVQGLSFNAGMSISGPQFAQTGEVLITASLQGLGVAMDEVNFKLAADVSPSPGAAPIATKIEGACQKVEALFGLPVKIELKATFNEQDQKFSITAWDWNVGEVPYTWISSRCVGPIGMSEFLRQRVFQKFVGSEQAKRYVIDQAQKFLNGQMASILESMFSQSLFDSTMSFQVERMKWTSTLFSFEGRVRVSVKEKCAAFSLPANVKRITLDAVSKTSLLVKQMGFPEDLILRALQCAHERGQISFPGSTRDIPDFRTLMESRTNQNYVWPDLGRYPTSQVFLMSTKTTDKLTIASQTATSGFAGTVSGQITSYWSSNVGPYVTFWTPFSASVKANIVGDKLELTMSQAKNVKVAYRFEQKVSDNFIDTSYFNQPVTDFISKATKSWPLPQFSLPNQRKVIPSALKVISGKAWIFTLKD